MRKFNKRPSARRRDFPVTSMKEQGNTAICGAYQPCLLSSLFVRRSGMAFSMLKAVRFDNASSDLRNYATAAPCFGTLNVN